VLAFGCSVPDFAFAAAAQGVLDGVVGFTLVRPDRGPALHVGIEQPFDDDQRAFDAADLAQGNSRFVPAGIGRELVG